MLDIKFVRENLDCVQEALKARNNSLSLENFSQLEQDRRRLLLEVENLKSKRNQVSQDISKMKRNGEDASEQILAMRNVGDEIATIEADLRAVEAQLKEIMYSIPNIPHGSVPVGKDEHDNKQVRAQGTPREFEFPAKPHWEIGEQLGILDFERAGKVSGARFVFYKGLGAKLERAVINFMLDVHTMQHGYTELLPPYIVNKDSMYGTGQLPSLPKICLN